jgi:8-oxo-dGTP pyrophosphatase MutT (NUDIX family)
MSPRPKHPTSSVFFFSRTPDGWRIGLIHHPRFGKWMLPGGHVERHENPAEAAVREVTEETGLPVYLMSPPGVGEPAGTSAPTVAVPIWVVEQQVPPESREPEPHVHVDHLFLGLAPTAEVPPGAELRFAWFSDSELDGLDMFPDTRVRARHLFVRLADPTKQLTPV